MRVKSSPTPLVLTAPEVAAVVSQLEGESCSARQVRYLLSGLLGTDAERPHGQTRWHGPADVALMRLAVRLEAQGVSAWVVRVVLAYCGTEIRAAWASGAPVALVIRGVTGTIESLATDFAVPAAARVPLRAVWTGVERAMRQTRRARPHLWRWKAGPAVSSFSPVAPT